MGGGSDVSVIFWTLLEANGALVGRLTWSWLQTAPPDVAWSHDSRRMLFVDMRAMVASSVISAWSRSDLSPVATARAPRPEAMTPLMFGKEWRTLFFSSSLP